MTIIFVSKCWWNIVVNDERSISFWKKIPSKCLILFLWVTFDSVYNTKVHITWSAPPIHVDIHGRSQNLRHFYPGIGAQIGGFEFSHNLNDHCSSGAGITCVCCGQRVKIKINMRKMPHGVRRLWTHFVLRLFLRVWSAKTWRPPSLAPWPTAPLHVAVYEVWDLYLWSAQFITWNWATILAVTISVLWVGY